MSFRSQRRALFVALFVSIVSGTLTAQESPPKATVQGMVTLARNGEPLAGATVSVFAIAPANTPNRDANPAPTGKALTDANGAFSIEELDAGSYRLSVASNGYVRVDIPRIELKAGQKKTDVSVHLTKTASISGRIMSSAGKPMPGLSVSLLRRTYSSNGTPGYSNTITVQTNDLGEYRAYWITPGRYVVSVAGRSTAIGLDDPRMEFNDSVSRGLNTVAESYTQIFFPGVAEESQAAVIDLQEGVELRDIHFTLPHQQQETFSIRGRLIDGATGRAPAQASIALSRRSLTDAQGSSATRWYDATTGNFEVPNLSPGRYGVSAQIGQIFPINGPQVGTAAASITVTIENSDVDNIVLTLKQPPVVQGRIKIEGQLPASTPIQRLRVTMISTADPTASAFPSSASATVAQDATFKLAAIPGEFRIGMSNLPPGFYLKSAMVDSADVLSAPRSFNGNASLEIVISATAGEVRGVVLNRSSRPASGIEAVLLPAEVRDRPELVKRATTDSEGQFTIAGITPGDYKVFAWERLEANSFFDPDVMKKYEDKGTPVHVSESSRQSTDVRLIPEVEVQQ